MFLHQNVSFALFAKFGLTGSYAYEFLPYYIKLAISEDLASSSIFINYIIAFNIASICVSHKSHTCLIIGTSGSELMKLPLKL